MVYPYRATFTVANEQRSAFVADKETFEQTLANANLVYTDLVYEDVTLTDAQLTRYRQIYLFPENEILACNNYVQNGTSLAEIPMRYGISS